MFFVAASKPQAHVIVSKVEPSKFVSPPQPFQRATGRTNSMPASSSMRAKRRLSSHEPDQRSGTFVAAIPDEQFGPKNPILRAFREYIARRSDWSPVFETVRATSPWGR
jgi:hypothetical protein